MAVKSIGIFDSGVGGLSVLRCIRALLPQVSLIYVADQAHVPYGPRPAGEVRRWTEAIAHFLLNQEAELIVVACNTATAAALSHLRQTFPQIPFVGMEPAVKPAAAQTTTGRVGVLATAGTFESQRYADLMARFARNVTVYEDPCPGLVELIESGRDATPETEQLLRRALKPMLAAGVDTIVLGCTHYPFVMPLIRRLVGPTVTIIDPAPAVARQAQRLWTTCPNPQRQMTESTVRAYTTGDPGRFMNQSLTLLSESLPTRPLVWHMDGNRPELINAPNLAV